MSKNNIKNLLAEEGSCDGVFFYCFYYQLVAEFIQTYDDISKVKTEIDFIVQQLASDIINEYLVRFFSPDLFENELEILRHIILTIPELYFGVKVEQTDLKLNCVTCNYIDYSEQFFPLDQELFVNFSLKKFVNQVLKQIFLLLSVDIEIYARGPNTFMFVLTKLNDETSEPESKRT